MPSDFTVLNNAAKTVDAGFAPHKPDEPAYIFFKRLVGTVLELPEEAWDVLPESARAWVTEGTNILNETPAGRIMFGPDGYEAPANAATEKPASRSSKPAVAKTTDVAASAEAPAAFPADSFFLAMPGNASLKGLALYQVKKKWAKENGVDMPAKGAATAAPAADAPAPATNEPEPLPEGAKPRKAREPKAPKTTRERNVEKVRKVREVNPNGVVIRMRTFMVDNPTCTRAQLADWMKENGLANVPDSTIHTIHFNTMQVINLIRSKGMLKD